MIELYGGDTPNVLKIVLALEEMGLEYTRLPLDILKGEQYTEKFLAISPNNKVPAIVDTQPEDGGGPQSVFESGAILIYLAQKSGKFLPADGRDRIAVLEWLMWQMSGQGPSVGQAGHFRNYAPEVVPYGVDRYTKESARLYGVLDRRLKGREFIVGDFSIADIACWPWVFFRQQHGIDLVDYPEVRRWYESIESRPCTARIMAGKSAPQPTPLDEEARRLLFTGGATAPQR